MLILRTTPEDFFGTYVKHNEVRWPTSGAASVEVQVPLCTARNAESRCNIREKNLMHSSRCRNFQSD